MVMRYENRAAIYHYKPEGFMEMGLSEDYVLIVVQW